MNQYVIILITLAASAFFSGMEIAFVASDKLRLELDKNRNIINAKLIPLFTKNPGHYIATMLVGNNIALVVFGLAFAAILDPLLVTFLHNATLLLLTKTIFSTLLILFIAEFLPKALFRINPNFALNLFAIPVGVFYFIFYPVTRLTMGISKILLKQFFSADIIGEQEEKVFGKIDLNNFIGEHDGASDEENENLESEIKLFRNALDFSNVKLRECMVPRPEIEALEETESLDNLRQRFVETGYSKILIFKDSIDNIIGYVHSSDLFNQPENIASCLRRVMFVPETMDANKLLGKFLREARSLAIVVDEFGGTAGLVTTEDILEEIFGEIEDEHDVVDIIDKKIADNLFIFSGRMEIDTVNEKYHLDIPVDDNYETIAGYILTHHPSIPKINTIINIGDYEIKILKGSKTRIELIELKILDNT